MTREISAFIGNKLGRFKDVDLDGNGEALGSSVRIRVALDITKPLARALKIRTVLGNEQLISFTYEHLSNFCYLCCCFGHLSRQCELQFQVDFKDPGSWLRAAASLSSRGGSRGVFAKHATPNLTRPTFVPHISLQSRSQPSPVNRGLAVFGEFSILQPVPSSPKPLSEPTVSPSETYSTLLDTHTHDLNLPLVPLKPPIPPAEKSDLYSSTLADPMNPNTEVP
ncbi:hypothetical protein Sango_0103700 [Sesamum angolense]|uniref:Zinc knuckle CX2CX4HX4C domain-containing protein n=1 Tax=Sesamum angolense TaxID=2727404 RepID=A0AAE1XF43_9LAMI|nr:hypothetical protein Sango_0103700 [Sesamum angolense]